MAKIIPIESKKRCDYCEKCTADYITETTKLGFELTICEECFIDVRPPCKIYQFKLKPKVPHESA